MHARRFIVLVGLLVSASVVVLGAASPLGATTGTKANAEKKPCSIVKVSDVQAAFGAPTQPGKTESDPIGPHCTYQVAVGGNLGTDGAVIVHFNTGPAFTKRSMDLGLHEIPHQVVVPGFGSKAVYNPDVGAIEILTHGGALTVQATFFNVGGPPVDPTQTKADVLALARVGLKKV